MKRKSPSEAETSIRPRAHFRSTKELLEEMEQLHRFHSIEDDESDDDNMAEEESKCPRREEYEDAMEGDLFFKPLT